MKKTRGYNRQKSKKTKVSENLKHSSRHRTHSLPPFTSSGDATPSMSHLCSHGNELSDQDRFKVLHRCESPTNLYENSYQDYPSPEEKDALVQEMETEFKSRRKVIVSGLPPESNDENLAGFFKEFSCKTVSTITKDGSVRVVFPTHVAASKALTSLNSTVVNYREINAVYGRPDSLLFVGNLPLTYTRKDLSNLFSPHGEILRCLVVCSTATGLRKGYGFVEYARKEEAVSAKEHLATKVVGFRSLRVDHADYGMQTCNDLHSETLFVDRLQKGFKDGERLRDLFAKYGTVNFCQVALAPGTGASRGFAFVDMSSSQEAELAQMSCNGTVFSGQAIRVSFGMPCRLGASILQHKPSVLHATCLNAPLMCGHTPAPPMYLHPYSPYPGTHHFPHSGGMLMHSRSEESLRATPMRLHPLGDITNTQFKGFHRKSDSLTHLMGPPLQCCLGHSLSTPSLTSVGSHPLAPPHTGAEYWGHHHLNNPPPPSPSPPPTHMVTEHWEDTDIAPPPQLSPPPDDGTMVTDTWGDPPLIGGITSQDEGYNPPPPLVDDSQADEAAWVMGGREEETDENPVPLVTTPAIMITVTDCCNSMLGKRRASIDQPLPLHEGLLGDGVYDQAYIGQHQQGIPFTHPLKRIKMERY